MNPADPYDLDDSDFVRTLLEIDRAMRDDEDDIPEEPPHPLASVPHVSALCAHLQTRKRALFQARKPNGGMGEDAYFVFNEGLMLRPEVVAKMVIDYVKEHPEILSAQLS